MYNYTIATSFRICSSLTQCLSYAGNANVTLAPGNKASANGPVPVREEPTTQLSLLSDSIMDKHALNEEVYLLNVLNAYYTRFRGVPAYTIRIPAMSATPCARSRDVSDVAKIA